jgi:hypothetical protein
LHHQGRCAYIGDSTLLEDRELCPYSLECVEGNSLLKRVPLG